MVHYREPVLVEAGMEHFREWVCEMQAEREQVGWAVIPALKDRISNFISVSVMSQMTVLVAGIFRSGNTFFIFISRLIRI